MRFSATRGDSISTHAPRTGSDVRSVRAAVTWTLFQPTLPARGATTRMLSNDCCALHFNPRSPHGERLTRDGTMRVSKYISTHAPRTGSDRKGQENDRRTTDFNPRSPHGERPSRRSCRMRRTDFNPRSPHGERPGAAIRRTQIQRFQPTLPARGATPDRPRISRRSRSSTHAPRTGSDDRGHPVPSRQPPFQPTLPARGATRFVAGQDARLDLFQPTLPARGATRTRFDTAGAGMISTHAPRRGSDGGSALSAV